MNNLCKIRMPFAVKKIMAAILSLLMIISSFFPVNRVYAADNGEMVLKSASHPEAVGEAVIDGNNITITLPFGNKLKNLDVSGIKCKSDTGFKLAEILFPSGSEANIGGSSVIMDVNYTYTSGKDTSNKYSTRYYVSVESGKAPVFGGTISKATTINKNIVFKLSDFADLYKQNNGEKMGFISIGATKNTAGVLKYKGEDYKADTHISVSDVEAGRLSFNPSNAGEISYAVTGYADDENKTNCGKAALNIKVEYPAVSVIKFSGEQGKNIKLSSSQFIGACSIIGGTFDYISFDSVPSSSKGKLYIDYVSSKDYASEVVAGKDCNKTDLDRMTFVPHSDYFGKFSIPYKGYNRSGEMFTGEVEINVAENKVTIDAETIAYKTGSYTPKDFDSDDFSAVCRKATGKRLDYIKFSVPSSSYGTMYYKYGSSRSESKISGSDKYYADELDDITFVPKSSYTGAVVIPYTGYNTDGKAYTGVVKVTVTKEIPVADAITVSTKEGNAVRFDDEDFNDASEDLTDEELDYAIFTLPSSKYGKLYYNYTSANKYDSEVSSSKKYYYDDNPSLSKITFVPYKNYSGTVTIKYMGYNTDGYEFSGTVEVEIKPLPKTEESKYFKDVTKNYSWASYQIDYLYENGIVNGTGNNNYGPAQNMKRGDFMLMLYRALDLSATDRGNFTDVPKDSYYYKAVAVAKALGIAKGSGDKFMPAEGITREDAMVLVDRALTVDGKKLPSGKDSDLSGFKDRKKVSDYAYHSVATLVRAGIIQGSNSNLNPKSFISRAEMAVILYKVLELD